MSSKQQRRQKFRPVAAAGLLVVGALSLVWLIQSPGERPDRNAGNAPSASRDSEPPDPAAAGNAVPEQVGVPAVAGDAAIVAAEPGQLPVEPSFTIAVDPLSLPQTDRLTADTLRQIHEELLRQLRLIPRVDVIELASADDELSEEEADFRIEVLWTTGARLDPFLSLRVNWSTTRSDEVGMWSVGENWSLPLTVNSVTGEAVRALRFYPFPPFRTRPIELETVVLDTGLPNEDRYAALEELGDIPKRFAFAGYDERRIVASAAAEIAQHAQDPEIRGRLWSAMTEMDDPYLIGPLVDSVLRDPSEFVRVEAVKCLSRNFDEDARAFSALEYALLNDLSPTVRANARWEALDEDLRQSYFAATISNFNLPDSERLELLAANVSGVDNFLDYQAVRALVDISSRARPSTEAPPRGAAPSAVSAAQVTPLLMELLASESSSQIRVQAASALARHRDEPGVREALDEALQAERFGPVGWEIERAMRRLATPPVTPASPR